jgi:hypothetical protein
MRSGVTLWGGSINKLQEAENKHGISVEISRHVEE